MARTSENGEAESGPTTGAEEKWLARDGIKQEILIDLDQSSSSIGDKDWSFLPATSGVDITNTNDIFQDSVLFGSNITDPVNKEKIEKLLDNATNPAQKKNVSNVLLEIEKLSDMERLLLYFRLPLGRSSDVDPLRMPLNPLGSRPEIMQTVVWIQTHLEEDVEVSLPKQEVYEEYGAYCTENCIKPLSTADFGKVMKQVFPNVRPRRLGTRGHSRYCYSGLRKKGELNPPALSDLFCDNGAIGKNAGQSANGIRSSAETPDLMNEHACSLIREWAEKLLGITFGGINDLANYLVDKLYVDQRGKAAMLWNKMRFSQQFSEEESFFSELKPDLGDADHDNMRELKRKLQEQHSQAARRQSVQNRHSKKTRVMSGSGSSPQHQPNQQTSVQLEEKDSKTPNKKNCTPRSKRKSKEDTRRSSTSSLMDTADLEIPSASCLSSSSSAQKATGKMPIPRLTNNRSPRPPSAILLLSSQSQSPSPTTSVNKPKFIPIQPKPYGNNSNSNSNGSENGLTIPSLPQLKEEDGIFGPAMDPLDVHWGEGTAHDDEIAGLTQPGELNSDSPSPKMQNAELSQLRVLLQQNEAKKKLPTVGLLERRNVRFETPAALTDQTDQTTLSDMNGQNGVVPPSPNTRRRAFNFTPISPRLTPDVVPASPGASGTGQLRQLLSTASSGVNSPFVSPRQTPVPHSLPSSQPHSRHNSGHAVTAETPTSIVTEASNVSNDSAFVSPLNTPLSVSRSRHNSASNLLVNRVRHSSGANITVRHMPYTTSGILSSHEVMLNPSVRSRHSSAGSPSMSRSAPLSPLVQNFAPQQQQQQASEFRNESIRQDLRRRHVSAGVVLGMNRCQMVHSGGRTQTTLNSAAPLWGNDPLAQEIEGLLDSASSSVNDSLLNRSQSVPLHQMLNQFQLQSGQSQSFASLSQPSTPFGCGRPFLFNASAASSPYSYTATPVPTEWNDFTSHVNSVESGAEAFGQLESVGQELEGLQEIISEVYAKNQQELAPCLDGLDAEALHQPSSLSQMNFPGTTSGNMDSDPSLSCSDTGDGFPLSDLNDPGSMPNLIGAEDLAATLVALKEAPELNRLVQDVVDGQQQSVALPQRM